MDNSRKYAKMSTTFFLVASKMLHDYLESNANNFNLKGVSTTFKDGFMVSLHGGVQIDLNTFDPKNSSQRVYIVDQIVCLMMMNHHLGGKGYIGFWKDSNTLYIDLSINIPNLTTALDVAYFNKQIAIWDVAFKSEIIVANHRRPHRG